jgi:hypothetical protein
MKWLSEPVTKDFLQGLMCGMIIITVFVIAVSFIHQ